MDRIQFPTWTTYGVQDDMEKSWQTTTKYTGVSLENGTWKYHVNISDHNYEAGKYTTDVYIFRKNGNIQLPFRIEQFVTTVNYAGSLYLENPNFSPGTVYRITNQILSNNFTFEFDAKPNKTTPMYTNGTYAPTTANTYNFVVHSTLSSSTSSAGIGLSLGTNGAIAIAHSGSYFYVLLNYSGDLSLQHSYRFTIKNNIPYLYMDGKLIATGIAPLAPVNTLITFGFIGGDLGDYGNYSGYANNFVLYNNAR